MKYQITKSRNRQITKFPRRGIAMVLVFVSVTVALILVMTFLNTQSVATGMADSISRRAKARAVAESGLDMVVAYARNNPQWRAGVASGNWASPQAFAGGSFVGSVTDGVDTDGDGVIEGDGDLLDDEDDPVTVTVTGSFQGATQVLRAVVSPTRPKRRLLFAVPNPGALNINDQLRKSQFLAWDYDVVLIDEDASLAEFDAAYAEADVLFIPETIYSVNLQDKIAHAPIGIVMEEGHLNDAIGLSDADGSEFFGGSQINIVDTSHFISSWSTTGLMTITDSAQDLRVINGDLSLDAHIIARRPSDSAPVFATLEAGARLEDGTSRAAGRRVSLPWGGSGFDWTSLEGDTLTYLQRSLSWASQPIVADRLAHWPLDEPAGPVVNDTVRGFDGTTRNGVSMGQTSAFFDSPTAVFDGINDFIEIPHNDAFLLNHGTIMLWFRADAHATDSGLFSKDSDGHDNGGHVIIQLHNNHIDARIQSKTSSYRVHTADFLQLHTWYHVALTFGSGGMKVYINGQLLGSDGYTGGLGTSSGGSGNREPIAIGVGTLNSSDGSTNGWNMPFRGAIEDVQVFGRQLSQTEIISLVRPLTYSVRWVEASDLH